MSKYINFFYTKDQYNDASAGLPNPSVSYIQETGEVFYNNLPAVDIKNAKFGEMLIVEKNSGFKMTMDVDEWYADSRFSPYSYYPSGDSTESWDTLGICVKERNTATGEKATFLHAKMLGKTVGSTTFDTNESVWSLYFGLMAKGSDVFLGNSGEGKTGKQVFNLITQAVPTAVKDVSTGSQVQSDDWSASDIENYSPAMTTVYNYSTSSSDLHKWYIPSLFDLKEIFASSTNRDKFAKAALALAKKGFKSGWGSDFQFRIPIIETGLSSGVSVFGTSYSGNAPFPSYLYFYTSDYNSATTLPVGYSNSFDNTIYDYMLTYLNPQSYDQYSANNRNMMYRQTAGTVRPVFYAE